MKKWILGLVCVLMVGRVQAERNNIDGLHALVIVPTDASSGTTTLSASTPITSTMFPVGRDEDVALGVYVAGLGATDTVTVTTLVTGSSLSEHQLLPYAVPSGLAAERIISENGAKVYPVIYPLGVESIGFTVEAGPSAGAKVRMVVSGQ